MQGQGLQIEDAPGLLALAVMTHAAYAMGKTFSPRRNPVKTEEQALEEEFRALPLPLKRGCLKYARELRQKYGEKAFF